MSEHLSDSALRLCGELCRSLGWPPQAFWQATPAEIFCIFANQNGDPAEGLTRGELAALLEQDRHE
ncbi:phage tail assembly chaperone [Aurantiacibacter xanthus]|uniref:Phage tail assembly chaperone n=1 Tax=Aurantiacibacter xanthus TaxID=1784712 RepID=A0A3A1PD51_9SPHN|nr:phage tail assembly chaperone [Aurantiacibacter xanthus]RIV90924.1 phage tail assembly chaperone [Aurantiacibacter xanthus]